jgi:hypothetical protein
VVVAEHWSSEKNLFTRSSSVRFGWSGQLAFRKLKFLTTCYFEGKKGKKRRKKKEKKKKNIAGLSPGRWPEPEMIPLVHKVSCAWKR